MSAKFAFIPSKLIVVVVLYLVCFCYGCFLILCEVFKYNQNIGLGLLFLSIGRTLSKIEWSE